MPNVERVDTELLSKHFRNDRQQRQNLIDNLGGMGTPIATFLVFDYDSNCNKLHTITDNGVLIIQSEKTKKIITIIHLGMNKINEYWRQLQNTQKPRLPKPIWNNRHGITKFHREYRRLNP